MSTPTRSDSPASVAVIGGGPAGLMAAEVLRAGGCQVDLYERMGSVGRKFLLAGKGGLNLTHAEPAHAFRQRFGERNAAVSAWLDGFDADALRAWARGLGVETFIGTSGRVFPQDLKAAPLLRGWVRRLRQQGVRLHMQHRWTGFEAGDGTLGLRFEVDGPPRRVAVDAVVLALGGASWPQLGSDGPGPSRCARRAWTWPRFSRPTAASRSPGASTCAPATPERRSSRWRWRWTTRRRARASW